MSSDDNDLARTATAPAVSTAPVLGATLGRYRLERQLGEGGMGVVHAAYDADLERRVAVKVLRAGNSDMARQRLLREARAMARLAHPNVVTVHEVGNAGGRDFVAMELIDGETLADWLRSETRDRRDILDAFAAAGRGLAAAHAAGFVHRDFKPHNVLRRRDGRILVTDFGLARGVELALETTIDASVPVAEGTPSSLSGLTATGSVLGTPPYMPPEQWGGGGIGPATDQFAFCVALWEALSGERPFRGTTLDELKAEVTRGPATLDASRLPRRLRAVLRRGLDPDPARRWPSMDALLAAMTRAVTWPRRLALAIGAVVVGAGVVIVALGGRDAPAVACPPLAHDPEAAWPASARAAWRASGRGALADAIERDVSAWTSQRVLACAAPEAHRDELACLDGVIARADTVRRAAEKLQGELGDDALAWLVDPAACGHGAHLRLEPTADTVDALALSIDSSRRGTKVTDADARAFAAKPGLAACPRAIALDALGGLVTDGKPAMVQAITAAEACADDNLIADVLLDDASVQSGGIELGPNGRAAIERARVAVDKVPQADLTAWLDSLLAQVAAEDNRWDDAWAALDRAIIGYGERGRVLAQLGVVGTGIGLRFRHNGIGDMEAVRATIVKWRPVAVAAGVSRHPFDQPDAMARLFLGDMTGAHADLVRLWKPQTRPDGQRVEGVVVDVAGKPVAGATVASGSSLMFDSIGPLPFGQVVDLRIATTGADGTFVIPDVAPHSALAAQHDALRSPATAPAAHVQLVLAPTRHLDGVVALAGASRTQGFVMAQVGGPVTYSVMAPLAADGRFSIDGAPMSTLRVGVATWDFSGGANSRFQEVPAGAAPVHGLALDWPSTKRTLDVVVRSTIDTPLKAAVVFVVGSKTPFHTLAELFAHREPVTGFQMGTARPVGDPPPLPKAKRGDVAMHFTSVVAGALTVCAVGLTSDVTEEQMRRLWARDAGFESHCQPVAADDTDAVVAAPPQKRSD